MQSTAVLLDTDIGSDIDDAIALAYLLRQPHCDLLGITTVSGDVRKRAALAHALCRAAGKSHIPIHCGRRNPLFDGPGQPNVPQFKSIERDGLNLNWTENTAVSFLRDQIRARPHEITLLTIGPLSNIALLFALDPEIPFLLKSVVSMAGVFFEESRCEWNCLCDPTACSMVYHSKRKQHDSVGLDVTEKCTMQAEEVKRRFVGEPLSLVLRMADAWFQSTQVVTFHDPLAAAAIFNPTLLKWESSVQ
jgi:purine nucleosidase